MKYIDNDFLGHLKGKSQEIKKIKVLEIYRYLFRFSIQKMKQLVDDPILILITLEYL